MKTKKIRTPIDSEYVFRRASEGASALQISKELGCSRTPIITFFQQNGLAFKKKVYNLPVDEIIGKYKNDKMSADSIAKQYGCTQIVVYRILKKHGIEANTDRDYKDTLADENFFEVIDSEPKAYLLGLIAADGCVRVNKNNGYYLSLSLIDEELIRQAAEILGWKGTISYRPPRTKMFKGKPYKCKASWRITIGSKKLVADLIRHGIGIDKSEKLHLPALRKDLKQHFIRGFFDGDGCVTFCNPDSATGRMYKHWRTGYPFMTIIGLEAILLEMQQVLVTACGVSVTKLVKEKRVKKMEMYTLNYNGTNAIAIRDFMYSGASVYLERKKNKFYSVEVPDNFTGYTVESYSEKFGFNNKTVRLWVDKGVIPHVLEWDRIVIPVDDGDRHAKYMQDTVSLGEAAEWLDLTQDQLYQLMSNGKIGSFGKSRMRNRIEKVEIERLLSEGNYKPTPPPEGHGVAGLSWNDKTQKWVARVSVGGCKRVHLGGYDVKEHAVEILRRASEVVDGDYKGLYESFKKEMGGKILPKGVSFCKSHNKYDVTIGFDGQCCRLGKYADLERALEVRKKAEMLKPHVKTMQELVQGAV